MSCKHVHVEDVTTTAERLDGLSHLVCLDCQSQIIESRVEGRYEEFIPSLTEGKVIQYDLEMLETWAHCDEAPVDEMAREILERRFKTCSTCANWIQRAYRSSPYWECILNPDAGGPDEYCSWGWEARDERTTES